MSFLQTLKSLNPLNKFGPSSASRAAAALRDGQSLGDVMRAASEKIAITAVREALEAFSDGPAALLITCLIESSTAGWDRLAAQLSASKELSPEAATWVAHRMVEYGESLSSDLMSQHLINLVLSVTGLHVEMLVLTRSDVDARMLTQRLGELLKKGLSSGLSRSDLAQTLSAPRPTARQIEAPRPSAKPS